MNKELFIETIEQLRLQDELDRQVSFYLGKVFPNAFEANLLPDNHFLRDQIIKLLEVEMGDVKDKWIDYFICELDFGREFEMGMVKDKDGSNIDLSDAGKLWEFLRS